jgi:hypothetical protein
MKHFNYLNQRIHVNNLKMKNLLDHQSTIRSSIFVAYENIPKLYLKDNLWMKI